MSLAVLWGQAGLGSIQGTAMDQSGVPVPNSKVVAVHVDAGGSFPVLRAGQEAVVAPEGGGTTRRVTVAGDVIPLVRTTNATLATTVDRARVEKLLWAIRFSKLWKDQ
jgi:hypothetical protein